MTRPDSPPTGGSVHDGVNLRLLWPQWQGAGASSVEASAGANGGSSFFRSVAASDADELRLSEGYELAGNGRVYAVPAKGELPASSTARTCA